MKNPIAKVSSPVPQVSNHEVIKKMITSTPAEHAPHSHATMNFKESLSKKSGVPGC